MDPTTKELDSAAVENFRQYLRIPSVHPNINYDPCVEFLQKQAKELGLLFNVYRNIPDNPMVVFTWMGKDPNLPTILLNSHMDVVPVFEEHWIHKPFDADIDENGDIYARGAQDTKCTGIQYLEAVRRLKKSGFQPKRTVHITFAPDEETGGSHGWKDFVQTADFKKLNIGFALDEGVPVQDNTLLAYYGEKRSWKISIHCPGQPGHGSLLLDNTAGEKVQYIIDQFYKFRAKQKAIVHAQKQSYGYVATVNLTVIQGGVQSNVIPSEFIITFDTRVPVDQFDSFESDVRKWCKEAGEGIWIEDIVKDDESPNTIVDDSNPFWTALKETIGKMGLKLEPAILMANGDARFLRAVGVPTIGFSPNQNTPNMAHGHNEYLNVNVFLDGVTKYTKIIPAIANV